MYIKFKGVKIMEVDIKKDVDVKEAVLTNPEKKTTKRKTTKAVKKVATKVVVQYDGKDYFVDQIIDKIKESVKDAKSIQVYIKPEDQKAYYVADGVEGVEDL